MSKTSQLLYGKIFFSFFPSKAQKCSLDNKKLKNLKAER